MTKNPQLLSLLNRDGPHGGAERSALNGLSGVTMHSQYEGVLVAHDLEALLGVEPGGFVAVTVAVTKVLRSSDLLRSNRDLQGNVRFAHGAGGLTLLADTCLDRSVDLAPTFDEIRQGLLRAQAPGRTVLFRRESALDPNAVQQLLEQFEDSGLAEAPLRLGDDQWELRLHLERVVVPLVLRVEPDGLRLQRFVVGTNERSDSYHALATQALRLNAELREARLSISGTGIVAETRLHPDQLQIERLARAAQAVASAWHHAQATLRILAEQEDLSLLFCRMFCSDNQKSKEGKKTWEPSRASASRISAGKKVSTCE